MNTRTRVVLCLVSVVILTGSAMTAHADEPTWLFSVPKAEALRKNHYNVGFVYADFGIAENLELGIHGLKYSMPGAGFAFGLSLFPMASPYLVWSPDIGSAGLHLGLKTTPYVVFAGFEVPLSSNVKFVAELTNGVSAGIRIFPAQNWTLDIFAAFVTLEAYKYNYGKVEIEDFDPLPGIFVAYSGRL